MSWTKETKSFIPSTLYIKNVILPTSTIHLKYEAREIDHLETVKNHDL